LDTLDLVGDGYLFDRLHRLADASLGYPLLSLTGNTEVMRDTRVELTETGRDVLEGKTNFVELNGIDDWVCGTHLDSNVGRVWFHNNGKLVPDYH
jgi:hypothetical protein